MVVLGIFQVVLPITHLHTIRRGQPLLLYMEKHINSYVHPSRSREVLVESTCRNWWKVGVFSHIPNLYL